MKSSSASLLQRLIIAPILFGIVAPPMGAFIFALLALLSGKSEFMMIVLTPFVVFAFAAAYYIAAVPAIATGVLAALIPGSTPKIVVVIIVCLIGPSVMATYQWAYLSVAKSDTNPHILITTMFLVSVPLGILYALMRDKSYWPWWLRGNNANELTANAHGQK